MLEAVLASCQKHIPGVRWVVKEGAVFGEVYGTEFRVVLSGTRAFVLVAGKRRCRPLGDPDDLAALLRESMVRRRDALNRALEIS